MAKKYGLTWWGEQWLHAFKGIDYTNRLPRGHAYAGNGSVLDVKTEGCSVSACVQGSRRTPYRVQVELPAFTKQQQKTILDLVSKAPPVCTNSSF